VVPRATQVTLCGGLAAPNTNPTFADSATSTTIPPHDPSFHAPVVGRRVHDRYVGFAGMSCGFDPVRVMPHGRKMRTSVDIRAHFPKLRKVGQWENRTHAESGAALDTRRVANCWCARMLGEWIG
jgi:hypothetical protein